MDIREYLFRKKMTVAEFGRQINYSRIHLSKIIHGERRPSPKLAKIIEKATNSEVKAEDLLKEQK